MFCLFQLKCINKQRFYRIVHTGSPGFSSFKRPDGDGGSQVQYFCIVQRLYYTILYYRYFHITEYRKELSALFSQPLAC